MADLSNTRPANLHFSASAVFNWIFNALAALGESRGIVRKLQFISDLSDAEIEARGTTREKLVRQTLINHGML